jgi:hypothetical protein
MTPGVAFDSDRQTLVLFGGLDPSGKVLNDTWEWNAAVGWTQRHPSTIPAARSMTVMVYDRARHVTLMYGGRDAVGGTVRCGELGQWFCSDDTWTWNGVDWTQFHPATSPPPFVPTMTYDESSNVALLYNFMGSVPGTWSWDGASWTLQASGPSNPDPGRATPVMAFDPATRHVVIFGGFSQGGNASTMWSWTGHGWTSLGIDAPIPRLGGIAAPDADRKVLVTYQNPNFLSTSPPGSLTAAQTWTWDGSRWTQLHPSHEPAVSGVMFADPKSDRVLLWGTDFTNGNAMQFWAWDGADWKQIA